MTTKTFCPIMTIGFEPPEEGKRDNRICMKDCAWYDIKTQGCKINLLAATLENIEAVMNDISDTLIDAMSLGGNIYDYSVETPYDEEEFDSQGSRRYP